MPTIGHSGRPWSRSRPDARAAGKADEEHGHGEHQGSLCGGGGGASELGLEEAAGDGAADRTAELTGGVEDA